ncbi:MAG: hypothetical protein D6714_03265 [Bacteroidetes bacterium]|nr:MAG: hypothetical protein D6714_03265 [Bacteroidota bacterium]
MAKKIKVAYGPAKKPPLSPTHFKEGAKVQGLFEYKSPFLASSTADFFAPPPDSLNVRAQSPFPAPGLS